MIKIVVILVEIYGDLKQHNNVLRMSLLEL